jgi:hypothetical protein
MRPIDAPLTREGKALILAYDHGLEHGPTDFTPRPESANPEHVFEVATHDAVTSLAVGKGIAEAYYPSYDDEVSLLAKLNGTSNLWMGEPDSAVNCSVEYARDIGADHAIVSVVTATPSGSTSVGGDLSVVIMATSRSQNLRCRFEDRTSPLQVNVTIQSPRASAWEQYFEGEGYTVVSSRSDRVVATFNTSEFYLADTSVAIEYVH